MPTSHHELKAPYRNGYVKLNDSTQPPKMPEPAVTKSEGAIAGFRPDSPATKSSTRRELRPIRLTRDADADPITGSIPVDPPLDSSPLPLTLRTWFWSILLVFMTVLAAVLELLLHFSSRSQGVLIHTNSITLADALTPYPRLDTITVVHRHDRLEALATGERYIA